MIDIHQHVTADVGIQMARARDAGAVRVVLLSTGVHPETASTLADVRDEFRRLSRILGGEVAGAEAAAVADAEVASALTAAPDAVAMQKVPLSMPDERLLDMVAKAARTPRIVGLGELTPPAGQGALIEPVVRAAAEVATGAPLPVLTHGFAPNTDDDLRAYGEMARRYPSVPLIIGAFGGLNSMLAIEIALAHRNVFLDLSSALQVFLVGVALRELPEQCLFGSNTPYGDVRAARVTVEAASHDRGVLDRALRENAAELLRL